MIQRATEVLATYEPIQEYVRSSLVEAIFDEVLPQVNTVVELEALPNWTVLLNPEGWVIQTPCPAQAANAFRFGPLTVVWKPEVTS